jgi:single-strand DNA-binding protein
MEGIKAMSNSINTVVLMGRLTAAPDLKTTTNGTSVTSFTLAVDRRYQQGGEKKADFINCVAWRSTAEFITKYFNKGDLIAVTGEIQTRNYEDKNKNKRTAVEVVANEASFCGGKNNSSDNGPEAAPITPDIQYDDDLPF